MIIVPIVLRMYGMGIYGPGWPSTIDNSALNSIILHIMSIFTITGAYKYGKPMARSTSLWIGPIRVDGTALARSWVRVVVVVPI